MDNVSEVPTDDQICPRDGSGCDVSGIIRPLLIEYTRIKISISKREHFRIYLNELHIREHIIKVRSHVWRCQRDFPT